MDTLLDRWRTRLGSTRVFASAESRRRFLVHLLAAVAILLAAGVLVRRYVPFVTDAERLRAFVRGFGVWGPVVLVAAQALQVVLAPVPGQVLAVVAGYLFGAWWGTVYNVVGVALGSAAAFWLSRRYGRAYVASIFSEDALARFDAIGDDRVRLALFVLFVVPGLPDDLLCFVGGLSDVPLWQLIVIAVVGRAPAFFLVNVVGDLLGTDRFWAAVALAAALIAVSVLGYLYRDRFVDRFGGES